MWKELEERHGECSRPLLYQIKMEISSISQGHISMVKYFTKLKILWDELACFASIAQCNCGAAKQIVVLNANDYKLM